MSSSSLYLADKAAKRTGKRARGSAVSPSKSKGEVRPGVFTTSLYTATGGETRRVEDGQSTQKRLKMARASSAPPGRHTSWARTCVPHTMARTWAGPTQTGSRPAAPAGQPGQRGRQRPATADGARLGAAARRRSGSAALSLSPVPPCIGAICRQHHSPLCSASLRTSNAYI